MVGEFLIIMILLGILFLFYLSRFQLRELRMRLLYWSHHLIPPPDPPDFNISSQWHILIKKWKLHRCSYCRILICLDGSLARVFTWQCSFIPEHLFALGFFHLTLNWIQLSDLTKESLTIQNMRKRIIDFSNWTPSLRHTVAIDTDLLLKPFSFISIHLLPANLYNAFNFTFRDI